MTSKSHGVPTNIFRNAYSRPASLLQDSAAATPTYDPTSRSAQQQKMTQPSSSATIKPDDTRRTRSEADARTIPHQQIPGSIRDIERILNEALKMAREAAEKESVSVRIPANTNAVHRAHEEPQISDRGRDVPEEPSFSPGKHVSHTPVGSQSCKSSKKSKPSVSFNRRIAASQALSPAQSFLKTRPLEPVITPSAARD